MSAQTLPYREFPSLHPNIRQFEVGSFKNFVYAVLGTAPGPFALVDAHRGVGALLEKLTQEGYVLGAVLLTHSHWDHVDGLEEITRWAKMRSPIPLYVHRLERGRLPRLGAHFEIRELQDGMAVAVRQELSLRVLHTPGHTAGECSFVFDEPPAILTGDTLFMHTCGRTDLPSGDLAEMLASLHRIRAFPPATRVFPGHHYGDPTHATLGEMTLVNPALQAQTLEELGAIP